MGSPGSPGYSMAICMYFEQSFRDSLYDYQKLFGIARYFDDLRAFIVFDKTSPASKSRATQILNLLTHHCYHESMILIPEKCDNHSFLFLESQINMSRNKLTSTMFNKNTSPLLLSGRPKSLTGQSFHSFSGDSRHRNQTRLGVVLG